MILRLTRLWRWLIAVNHWLAQPWLIWVTLLLVAAALLIPYEFSLPVENSVRMTGLVFQLLGLMTVAKGLRETRILFQHPNSRTLLLKWLRDIPRFTPRISTVRSAQARFVLETASIVEELRSESRSREAADQELQRRLEEFAVGGLHLESIGLVWILMGVFLATASVEIAGLIKILTKTPYANNFPIHGILEA